MSQKYLGGYIWIFLAPNEVQWHAVVNRLMNLWVQLGWGFS